MIPGMTLVGTLGRIWPGYYYPWAYGGAVAANVYGRWGNSVVAGTAAGWANPWTGNYGRAGAGGFYNTATGGRGYGYAGRNTNIYTGNSTAAAGGVRYNPETGRAVAGHGAAAGNIYTGNGAAAGGRTVVNTDTGRVTREAGGVSRSGAGATAAGGFNTNGAGGNAQGAGYIHYDRATGDVNRAGAVNVNGDVYAGHDGNVIATTKAAAGRKWATAIVSRPRRNMTPRSMANAACRIAAISMREPAAVFRRARRRLPRREALISGRSATSC